MSEVTRLAEVADRAQEAVREFPSHANLQAAERARRAWLRARQDEAEGRFDSSGIRD